MPRLKIAIDCPGGLDPAAATSYAQAAVDELARAHRATTPPRERGGLRTSFTPGADPLVYVVPREMARGLFDRLLVSGLWATPDVGPVASMLGAAYYGLTDPAAVLQMVAAHAVALAAHAELPRPGVDVVVSVPPGTPASIGFKVAAVAADAEPRQIRVSAADAGNRALVAIAEGRDWRAEATALAAAVAGKLEVAHTPPPPAAPAALPETDWRHRLTADDRATVMEALETAAYWGSDESYRVNAAPVEPFSDEPEIQEMVTRFLELEDRIGVPSRDGETFASGGGYLHADVVARLKRAELYILLDGLDSVIVTYENADDEDANAGEIAPYEEVVALRQRLCSHLKALEGAMGLKDAPSDM